MHNHYGGFSSEANFVKQKHPVCMAFSYKKLWKLLIDLDMKKKNLQQVAGGSPALIEKLGRNENMFIKSLERICTALHCDKGDIVEIV